MASAGANAAQAPREPSSAPASAPSSPSRHKRYLRNYLLDKGIQLRYILFVTALSVLLCAIFGYFIWQQKNYASQVIRDGLNRADWIDAALKTDIIATLRAGDMEIVWKMAGFAGILVVVLSGFLLIMTHKVAGPLYKIGIYFDRIKEGQLGRIADLRRGDQFQDFFERFKEMHETVRLRTARECEVYDRFLRACEREGDLSVELRQKLEDLAKLKREKEESVK